MCVRIRYKCPACKGSSGHAETRRCRRKPCSGLVRLERQMKTSQFAGWTCPNSDRRCTYSPKQIAFVESKTRKIVQTQRAGGQAPMDDDDLRMYHDLVSLPYCPQSRSANALASHNGNKL